jgi:hypothetical protein
LAFNAEFWFVASMIAAGVGHYKLGDVVYRLEFTANIFATP